MAAPAESSWVARKWWDLQRFGLTPDKLARRVRNPDAPPVLLVSIPKSGTHLLERALCLHPLLFRKVAPTLSRRSIDQKWGGVEGLAQRLQPGQVAVSHLRYVDGDAEVLARRGVKTLFMIRNPRDLLVSLVHYNVDREDIRVHGLYANLPDQKERLRPAIVGDPANRIPSIGRRLELYRGWLDSGALVVRFEDLVGASGGGDHDTQLDTLRSIFRHLEVPTDERLLHEIRAKVFSTASPTFRKGSIGQSKQAFDEELEALYRQQAGEVVGAYGY
jgi:hypothetical protein